MSTILDIEQIEWKAVVEDLPDSDTTVLVHAPGADEPVWLGYRDGESWFEVGGAEYGNREEIPQSVTAWAPMPRGAATEKVQFGCQCHGGLCTKDQLAPNEYCTRERDRTRYSGCAKDSAGLGD